MRTALLTSVALAVLMTAAWNEPAAAQPDGYSDAYARAARKLKRTESVGKDEAITIHGRTKRSAKHPKGKR